jgi:glycosyltransferase involved in cell wall biosynthesis
MKRIALFTMAVGEDRIYFDSVARYFPYNKKYFGQNNDVDYYLFTDRNETINDEIFNIPCRSMLWPYVALMKNNTISDYLTSTNKWENYDYIFFIDADFAIGKEYDFFSHNFFLIKPFWNTALGAGLFYGGRKEYFKTLCNQYYDEFQFICENKLPLPQDLDEFYLGLFRKQYKNNIHLIEMDRETNTLIFYDNENLEEKIKESGNRIFMQPFKAKGRANRTMIIDTSYKEQEYIINTKEQYIFNNYTYDLGRLIPLDDINYQILWARQPEKREVLNIETKRISDMSVLSKTKNSLPAVSVVMLVYNTPVEYLKESVESTLSQTFSDFEFIIVDDGSTDTSCVECIESYRDPRIRLIRNKHDFIDSLNIGIKESQGKYIARMDSDDIMMPHRLDFQYVYMESHSEVDILGCGVHYLGESEEFHGNNGVVTVKELLSGNCIFNPTVMMRKNSILESKIQYSKEFIYAEDYHFFSQAAIAGLHIMNVSNPVLKYRISSGQVTSRHRYEQYKKAKAIQQEISQWLARDEIAWAETHPYKIPDTTNKLTVIIPFLNEKEEVRNTVKSVRESAGENVDIIVINDQSNDGYNYRKDISPYNVVYIYNSKRLGVAASRDFGINICKTPFFILLDAHMRFYNTFWAERIISILEKDDRCLLCSQTRFLRKDLHGRAVVNKECPTVYGAYIAFDKENCLTSIQWDYREKIRNEKTEEIAAVLGAGYAASKRYWEYLRGLQGLRYYGSDETFISLKVWLEGGKCVLLKDVEIGHIYRETSPYNRYNADEAYNSLFISNLLFPEHLHNMSKAVALLKNRHTYFIAKNILKEREAEIEEAKKYYNSIFTNSIDNVLKIQMKSIIYDTKMVDGCLNKMADYNEYVQLNMPENYGIFDGQAAVLIWFHHYSEYTHDYSWMKNAENLLSIIKSAILNEELSWIFENGTCGIAWAILYLHSHGFINENIDEVVRIIDKSIEVIDLDKCQDYSLATGAGGLYAYLSLRTMRNNSFSYAYREKLQELAIRVLDYSSDLSSIYYAMQYLSKKDAILGASDNLVDCRNANLNDWVSAPIFLPKESCYWNTSLASGCIGALIKAIQINSFNLKNN